MQKMILKKYLLLGIIAFFGLTIPFVQTFAICPVCTFAVGAGIGLSRWLGIDDSISGIWIGGMAVSLIGWTINWFNKINFRFYGRKILTAIFYYAAILIPLYYLKIIGHQENKIWGIDKIIFGTIIGSLAFLFANIWYEHLKKKNKDHAYFPMQKVIMPIGTLLALSLFFYLLTK